MTLIPWFIVGLLIAALVIVWTLSKARIYELEARLDAEQEITDALADEKHEMFAEIEKLREEAASIPPPPPVPYIPTHRRAWPTALKYLGPPEWTPKMERIALAGLAMECATQHEDCDCVATYRLLEHEAALGEGT